MLIEQLLAFCRKEPLEPRAIDLRRIVGELRSMLTQVAGGRIALRFELAATPLVHADRGQLEQVIVNLVANARDAMTAGGTVTIATELATVVDGRESIRLGIDPGSYAVLTVSDAGGGIDPRSSGASSTRSSRRRSAMGYRARADDRERDRPQVSRCDRRRDHAGRGIDVQGPAAGRGGESWAATGLRSTGLV